jgi:hypothetical protein
MSHQNIDKVESAIDKTPKEIWWDIFDGLINLSTYFETTYTGNDWTRDAGIHMIGDAYRSYPGLEKQRKIIGSVCRSWQLWARSRKHRCVDVIPTKSTFELDLERARSARRVWLFPGVLSWAIQSVYTDGVNWEILGAHPWLAANFPPIPRPQVRRICLIPSGEKPFDTKMLLLALEQFSNVTWLDHDTTSERYGGDPIEKDTQQVTMPNLQVLYLSGDYLQFPLSHVILPSLRYLAFHFWNRPYDLTLNDIILPYGQTLRAVIIRFSPPYGTETVQFPPWHKFPRLEHLVLSPHWSIQFDPIPPNHPLKNLVTRHASFDALASFLDAANMQQLLIPRAHWTESNGLMLDKDSSKVQGVAALEEKAKARGVRFAVSWQEEDEDKFVTRDEAK